MLATFQMSSVLMGRLAAGAALPNAFTYWPLPFCQTPTMAPGILPSRIAFSTVAVIVSCVALLNAGVPHEEAPMVKKTRSRRAIAMTKYLRPPRALLWGMSVTFPYAMSLSAVERIYTVQPLQVTAGRPAP